jgi:hypothetical protein
MEPLFLEIVPAFLKLLFLGETIDNSTGVGRFTSPAFDPSFTTAQLEFSSLKASSTWDSATS